MDWARLMASERFGQEESATEQPGRTDYQRDYDRLIFSAPFRRLQNKTQVFPLPGQIFVHNRPPSASRLSRQRVPAPSVK